MEESKKKSDRTQHSTSTPKDTAGSEGKTSKVIHLLSEVEALNERIAALEQESNTNLEGWQRERAEFSNYKKRIERENTMLRQEITGSVIKKYLVVLDDLDLALKNKPKGGSGEAWANGIEHIERKLLSIIENEGVERISENRVPFDPTIHEAISSEDNSDFESHEVIEVIRYGYKLGDRVLRPAMVRVAR